MQRPAYVAISTMMLSTFRAAGLECQNHIANTIGIGELQGRLGIEAASPPWIFLGRDRTRRVQSRKDRAAPQPSSLSYEASLGPQ